MSRLFHVTSSSNRASVDAYGLDWRLMNSASGIAGSTRPEKDGVFVCTDESDIDFFVRMNNTGGPVDVWAIDGVDEEPIESGTGFVYIPHEIPREALTLISRDIPPSPPDTAPPPVSASDQAYGTGLTIAFDDRTLPTGPAAHGVLDDLNDCR